MGRFERDDNESRQLPQTLGVATEGLRSTIELEVAKIVEGAEGRATAIESQALEKASRAEQDSARRLETTFEDSRKRLTIMLSEIDVAERALAEKIRLLRAQAQELAGSLQKAATEPAPPPEPPAPPEPEPEPEPEPVPEQEPVKAAAASDDGRPEAQPVEESDTTEQQPADAAPDPEIRDLIRQQLESLAQAGRTRADAERMLLRFRQGEQYFELLDEIYPEDKPARKGLLRRRKGGE